MGVQLDVKGDVVNTWRWFDEAPPDGQPGDLKKPEEEGLEEIEADIGSGLLGPEMTKAPGVGSGVGLTTSLGIKDARSAASANTAVTTTTSKKPQQQPQQQQQGPKNPALLAEMLNVVSSVFGDDDGGVSDGDDNAGDATAVEAAGDAEKDKEKALVAAPAIGVIAGKIDRNIGVKIVSQEKMSLSFQAENK